MADNTIDLAVRWREDGADVPARVRQHVQELGSVSERMGDAFQRFERREPTMVVRRSMFALEEFGAAALGASGRLGILASSVALMFPEAAIGVVALGVAIRALTQDTRENDEAQKQLIARLQQLGEHGKITAQQMSIGDLQQRLDDPSIGQRFQQAFDWLRGPLLGGSNDPREDLRRGIAKGEVERGIDERAFESARNRALSEAALRLRVAQLRLGMSGNQFSDTPASDLAVAEAVRRAQLEADPRTRSVAGQVAGEERRAGEIDASTKAVSGARRADEEAAIRKQMLTASEVAVTAAIEAHRLKLQGLTPALAEQTAATRSAAEATIAWTAAVRQSAQSMAFQLGAGNIAGAIQSLAHLAAKAPEMGLLGGMAVEFGAGLVTRLFGHHTQKQQVIVTAYTEQALQQLKELRGEALTTQWNIIGPADVRKLMQQLGRFSRMGVIQRQP